MLETIKDSELSASLVSRLPLRPAAVSQYGASPMKAEDIRAAFDKSAILIAERLNRVITLLTDGTLSEGIASLPYRNGITLGEEITALSDSFSNINISGLETRIRNLSNSFEEIQRNVESNEGKIEECADALADLEAALHELEVSVGNATSFAEEEVMIGECEFDSWEIDKVVRFGDGGRYSPSIGMKVAGGVNYFAPDFVCKVTSDRNGTYITDIFLGEYPLVYDEALGKYALTFTCTHTDTSSLGNYAYRSSFFINAPSDATVLYTSGNGADGKAYSLPPERAVALVGDGVKSLLIESADKYIGNRSSKVIFEGGRVYPRLLSVTPIISYGDDVKNGTFEPKLDTRYEMTLSYDGENLVADYRGISLDNTYTAPDLRLADYVPSAKKTTVIYATDGAGGDITIPYSKTETEVGSIPLRDFDGCLVSPDPVNDRQLTTKAYVDAAIKTNQSAFKVGAMSVFGKAFPTWTNGKYMPYGGNGMTITDSGMKMAGGVDFFEDGFSTVFVSNMEGAFVVDLYQKRYDFTYNEELKVYTLEYTQLTKSVYDESSGTTNNYRSCYINAPIDATVFYCKYEQLDYDIPILEEPAEYRLYGCGKKHVQLTRQCTCNSSQPLTFWFSADKINFTVAPNGLSLIFTGDEVVDGVFTPNRQKRYRMEVTGDGIAHYVHITGFPIPVLPPYLMFAMTDEDLQSTQPTVEELETMTANARAASVTEEEGTSTAEGGEEGDA